MSAPRPAQYSARRARPVIPPVSPGDCPADFRISLLRFAESPLRFGMIEARCNIDLQTKGGVTALQAAQLEGGQISVWEGQDPEGGSKKRKEVANDCKATGC
jgi:hypothetical protein